MELSTSSCSSNKEGLQSNSIAKKDFSRLNTVVERLMLLWITVIRYKSLPNSHRTSLPWVYSMSWFL